MQVDVVDDPSSGDSTEVPAQVVALRSVQLAECAHPCRGEAMKLEHLVVVQLPVLADVSNRRSHEVPRRIRELVQQDDAALVAMDDELLRVVAVDRRAEHATGLVVGRLDVLEAPRRPQLLHAGESRSARRWARRGRARP